MENKNDEIVEEGRPKVIDRDVSQEMKESFMSYAMAVNVSRAIPDIRDGLKPVHRRILYAMGELNLFSTSAYKKCARIVGEVLGKYHPHGDSSVYEALVRLAQDFSIRCPLVDGHGNFGSVDGDPAAAMRYTEARLSKIASEMLRDLEKNSVDFYPNFDETLMQPTVLPSRFPNILVNGADGIAVGMATNIPPHNLNEAIDCVVAMIDNPEIEIDDLINIMPAPDYPTGGVIMGRSAINHAYRTGRGGIVVRAKTEIETDDNGRDRIIITELPYQVNKAKLIEHVAELVKNKKLEGIADIKEESDREGMRIVIDIKRDANSQVVLNSLFKHTNLQVSEGIILLALVDGEPRVLNLREIIYYYLQHQREVIRRRTEYDLAKAEEKEHIVEGLVIALASIDEVIAIIKQSNDKAEASQKLQSTFELSEKQTNAILEMKLQKLTSLEVEKLNNELAELKAMIEEFKSILSSPAKIDQIIRTEITEIKEKFGTPRRTEISIDYGDIDVADLIPREEVVISMTRQGYIKRLPVSEYKSQHRGGKGVVGHKPKEEDFVERVFTTNSHSDLFFFTNFGKVYTIRAYEVPEAQKTSKGRAIVNLLNLAPGESATTVLQIDDRQAEGYLIMATRKGYIKKTPLSEFARINRNGKFAISLMEEDELINVELSDGTNDVLISTSGGRCIRFSETAVRAMGRLARGVRSIKLFDGAVCIDMTVTKPEDEILTISELGIGKRMKVEEIRKTRRGGKGVKAGKFNTKTGKLVGVQKIDNDKDIIVISVNGTMIRFHAEALKTLSRLTYGVHIMRLKQGDVVSSFAVTEKEIEQEEVTENGEPVVEQNPQFEQMDDNDGYKVEEDDDVEVSDLENLPDYDEEE